MKLSSCFARTTIVIAALLIPLALQAQLTGTKRSESSPFISFDAPGAGTGFLHGTYAFSVNLFAAVAGYDLEENRRL